MAPKPVRKDGERLSFTVAKPKNGTYGIRLAQTGLGSAVVKHLEGAAVKAALLEVEDRITHVNDSGPLDYDGVVAALKKEASPVKLTVVRGEPPEPMPSSRRGMSSTIGIISLVGIIGFLMVSHLDPSELLRDFEQGMAGQQIDATGASSASPAGGRPKAPKASGRREAATATSSGGGRAPSGISVGGQQYDINDDGTAVDPDALRDAMRADKNIMRDMRKNKPEWAAVISGDTDGTYNVARFQKVLKENFKNQKLSKATELKEDGSAVDPAGYLEIAKQEPGRKWLKMIKSHSEETYTQIIKGDKEGLDVLQKVLRAAKERKDAEERGEEPPAPPPNPPTPYDNQENVKVGMSMRILTEEGEEKDLFQVCAAHIATSALATPALGHGPSTHPRLCAPCPMLSALV